MKAGILFTGSGPVVLLTSYESFSDSRLVEKLAGKGIKKYLIYEIPVEMAKQKYGHHFNVIMGDLHQQDELRVLDSDGGHVFNLFSFRNLECPMVYEA
ncbi:MAG: hypothetical protein AB1646_02940 [Thermodesulfobacteriota bacterium]